MTFLSVIRVPLVTLVTLLAVMLMANCTSSSDGDLPHLDPLDASTEGGGPGGDCRGECDGKCGQLLGTCGKLLTCAGCSSGQSCGAGGPNVCGTGSCAASCAGKACGASDGCGGVCTEGSCGSGLHCASGICACDSTSCKGDQTCVGQGCYHLGKIVLFGGNDGTTYLADTWEWDGSHWERHDVAGPSARQTSAAALGKNMVLFGGGAELASVVGETWEWNGSAWTKRTPTTEPAPRAGAAMATLGNKVVLFGGFIRGGHYSDETWEWDGNNWAQRAVAGPPGRFYASMSTFGNKIVLFGGRDKETYFNDTWEWDGTSWTKRNVYPAPSARYGHGTGVVGDTMMLFGGTLISNTYSGEMWLWNGSAWSRKESSPMPVARNGCEQMPTFGNKVVLFGGDNGASMVDQWTWTKDDSSSGGYWSSQFANRPPARSGAAMVNLP